MADNEYYTTGEAAKMLGISRSTVSRKFDVGVLGGKKNPITGERIISKSSVMAFAKKYSFDIIPDENETKQVYIAATDSNIIDRIMRAMKGIKDTNVTVHHSGCDFIISCTNNPPDLAIIDDSIRDIDSVELIKAINRSLLDERNTILGLFSKKETLDEVEHIVDDGLLKSAVEDSVIKKYIASKFPAETPQDVAPVKFTHERVWKRVNVDLPADIIKSTDDDIYTPTSEPLPTRIINISLGGALLANINQPEQLFRNKKTTFLISVNEYPLENWQAYTKIVRIQSNGSIDIGVKFDSLDNENEEKLMQLINRTPAVSSLRY